MSRITALELESPKLMRLSSMSASRRLVSHHFTKSASASSAESPRDWAAASARLRTEDDTIKAVIWENA